MKKLTLSFVCSVLIISCASIVTVAATINTSIAVSSETENILPVETNGDFYACLFYPFCYDPDDFKPVHLQQTEPGQADITQQV